MNNKSKVIIISILIVSISFIIGCAIIGYGLSQIAEGILYA